MRTNTLITFFTLFLTFGTNAQTFEWAKSFGGSSVDRGFSITVDTQGNVYTTGDFEGTVDFDPGVGTAYLNSLGVSDVFIQKLDASGNFMWAKSFGGGSGDLGYSITVDTAENVYTIGQFDGTVDFDPGPGTAYLTSEGFSDIFVQKLDASGNFLWAKSFGGSSNDSGTSITTDAAGNVYTTGYFSGTGDFDPGVGTAYLTSAGGNDVFVQKLDASGSFLWAKCFGDSSSDGGTSIAVDATGNVYTTGRFQGTVDFDSETGTAYLTSVGYSDIFVQKLDTSGNFVWAKSFGDSSDDRGNSILVDATGSVYITGYFSGTVDFDPGAGTSYHTSTGIEQDIFVEKLDTSGNFVWAKSFGDNSDDYGYSIAVDASGNVYTTGFFIGTVDFDPGAGIVNLTSAGSVDVFIQKLDAFGDFVWAKSFGGSSTDQGRSIAVDASGNIYTTGYFSGTVDFDPGAETANLTSAGSYDVFVQKLSQCQPNTGTDIQVQCGDYTWIDGNTYTSSNNSATWTITNQAGCDSVVTLDLTINSVSNINTSLNGLTITSDNLNASYVWLDCDDNYSMLPGETSQSYTATANGNYAVELTENGCVDTSACVAIATVGILENTFSNAFTLFPNPTSGSFSIQFDSPQANVELKIMDLSGKVIENRNFDNVVLLEHDLDEPQGIYLIEVSNYEGERSMIRLIKQ